MYKVTTCFIKAVALIALVEFILFLNLFLDGYKSQHLNEAGVITVWAAVLTPVFLVSSVLGIFNIDKKIDELKELKEEIARTLREVEKLKDSIQRETDAVKNTAFEAKRDIVAESRKEVTRMLDISMSRQNLTMNLPASTASPVLWNESVLTLYFCRKIQKRKE